MMVRAMEGSGFPQFEREEISSVFEYIREKW